jgi:small-conductance mechanosensitive channel
MIDILRTHLSEILWIAAVAAIALVAVILLRTWAGRRHDGHEDLLAIVRRAQNALIAVVVIAALRITLIGVDASDSPMEGEAHHILTIVFIAALIWLAGEVLVALEGILLVRYAPATQIGDVNVRKARTQITVLRRLIMAAVIMVGVGAILMTFPAIRIMGQGVLASAGLISIVAGLAAQSTLTNVFAGIQLTLTNSMRVGDVVSVDGESGTVGEITLTYVVIYLWDDRRLILPSSHFTSNPYENWTRRGGRINGIIDFDVDWSVPLDALREELDRVLGETPLWDGRKGVLFVLDVTEGRVRLRIIVSAANTDDMFALNAHVREAMVRFVAEQGGAWLPRWRGQMVAQPALDPIAQR